MVEVTVIGAVPIAMLETSLDDVTLPVVFTLPITFAFPVTVNKLAT